MSNNLDFGQITNILLMLTEPKLHNFMKNSDTAGNTAKTVIDLFISSKTEQDKKLVEEIITCLNNNDCTIFINTINLIINSQNSLLVKNENKKKIIIFLLIFHNLNE